MMQGPSLEGQGPTKAKPGIMSSSIKITAENFYINFFLRLEKFKNI
jgi:hypothetical protein